MRYLQSWFLIDFLALVPFDLLGIRNMRGTRILRCLRLLKLARIVKGNRALQAWRHRTTVSYQTQDLIQTILTTLFLIHAMSCFFGMSADVAYATIDDDTKESCCSRTFFRTGVAHSTS